MMNPNEIQHRFPIGVVVSLTNGTKAKLAFLQKTITDVTYIGDHLRLAFEVPDNGQKTVDPKQLHQSVREAIARDPLAGAVSMGMCGGFQDSVESYHQGEMSIATLRRLQWALIAADFIAEQHITYEDFQVLRMSIVDPPPGVMFSPGVLVVGYEFPKSMFDKVVERQTQQQPPKPSSPIPQGLQCPDDTSGLMDLFGGNDGNSQ